MGCGIGICSESVREKDKLRRGLEKSVTSSANLVKPLRIILLVTLRHLICNHLKFMIIYLKRGAAKTFFISYVTQFLQGKIVHKPLSGLHLRGLALFLKTVYGIKLSALFCGSLLLTGLFLQNALRSDQSLPGGSARILPDPSRSCPREGQALKNTSRPACSQASPEP